MPRSLSALSPDDDQAAADFLKQWGSVSRKDMFERRMFLEDFSSVWNKIWNKEVSPHDVFAHRLFMRTFSTFDRYVPNDYAGNILVLGAGTGRAGIKIARSLPRSTVTIVSNRKNSAEMIKVLLGELKLTDAAVALEDPTHLSFADKTFDMIYFDSIEGSFEEYDPVIAELARVLKPGGRFIAAAVNRPHLIFSAYRLFAGREFSYRSTPSFTKRGMAALLKRHDISVKESHGFDPGYGSYVLDTTPAVARFFGQGADKLVRILNKLSFGRVTDAFGLGLFIVAEKPVDKNAMELAAMAQIGAEARQPLPTDSALKRVEIIVLKYKDPEVEWRAAKHILENTDWPYKMNFFDNRPGTKNMAKAWNKLIRESTCDYVLIMDSDVFVPQLSPCWLTRLMSNFVHEGCYVSLPKATVTSCAEQRAQKPENRPAHPMKTRFAGMCILYKKEIFEKVGYFDEEFLLRGSDIEWADRFLKSPYTAYISPDVVVEHVGSYSSKKANKKAEFSRALERIYANTLFNQKVR